jgi:hypothetical protein
VGLAATKLEQKIVAWTDKLHGVADDAESSGDLVSLADAGLDGLEKDAGAAQTAGVEGIKAGLHGKNPVWAAIKGAWHAGTPAVRAVIITAAVVAILLLLLSPVLCLVFLLSLLVIAVVYRARKPKT